MVKIDLLFLTNINWKYFKLFLLHLKHQTHLSILKKIFKKKKHLLWDFSSMKLDKEAFHTGLWRKQIKLSFFRNEKIACYWNINQEDEIITYITYQKPSPTSSPQLQLSKTSERNFFSSRNMCMTFPVANETFRRKTFSMSSIISK